MMIKITKGGATTIQNLSIFKTYLDEHIAIKIIAKKIIQCHTY